MTDRYTITELVMTKGTSAPVRVALLEMEKKIIALETENERLREILEQWLITAREHLDTEVAGRTFETLERAK